MSIRRIAVVASALGNDPWQIPTASRTLGFDGLQFDVFAPWLNLAEMSMSGRREFARMLAAQNQTLVALRGSLGPEGLGATADIDRLLSQFERALDVARSLACGVMCLDVGLLPAAPKVRRAKPRVTAEMAGMLILPPAMEEAQDEPERPTSAKDARLLAQCDAAMLELGKLADRYGIVVAMRSDLSPYSALDRALTAAGCSWFGVDLDPAAMLADEWEADEIFSRLGGMIRHVRARDAVKGQGGRTQPSIIGRGNVDWREMLARLEQAGYSGVITIDPTDLADRPGAAAAGLKVLRDLEM